MSIIEPSDEGEEQAEENQKSTPGVVMKHWNCRDTSNDIVLHLNLLLWLERAIVLPLIEEYIVSMATIVDSNRWFQRSASFVRST